jgi:hypothetical protein
VLDDQNDEGSYSRNPEALQSLLTTVFFAAVEPNDRAAENPLESALKTSWAELVIECRPNGVTDSCAT